jgi:hypothetical protein
MDTEALSPGANEVRGIVSPSRFFSKLFGDYRHDSYPAFPANVIAAVASALGEPYEIELYIWWPTGPAEAGGGQ